MARAKLSLPDRFPFSTELALRIGDINYGGHLGNDAVLSLLHEARIRFLAPHGYTETDIEGVGLIMTDAVIVYKSEAVHGETVRIDVAATDFNQYGCDFVYRVTERDSGREIARAKTGIVFFDYEARKIARRPDRFQQAVSGAAE